jgi:cation:H+ antiporter
LVDGASAIARGFGVPPIMIGLTIVAFGTSLPELIVSTSAALGGNSDIAFGNVLGSNIANIFFILGVTLLIGIVAVEKNTVRVEIPIGILAAVLMYVFAPDGVVSRADGIILLLCFLGFFIYTIKSAMAGSKKDKDLAVGKSKKRKKVKLGKSLLLIGLGLVILAMGADFTIDGASKIASLLGLSQIMIGLTIVAVGTSLPELVTSVVGALKKETEIVVGNLVGSNIFNTLWILGVTSVITPVGVERGLEFDLIMNILTFVLVFLCVVVFRNKKQGNYVLQRWQGGLLLLGYVIYMIVIINRELHFF